MKNYTLITLCSILISCTQQEGSNKISEIKVDGVKNFSDTLTSSSSDKTNSIEFDTVFFMKKIFISILPSERYLDSIQKGVPEDEWNEVVSDNEYYRNLTEQFLEKKGYKLIDKPNRRFWHFQLKNGNIQTIDTLNLHDKWGNIIYNGRDSAFYFDGTTPEEELKKL